MHFMCVIITPIPPPFSPQDDICFPVSMSYHHKLIVCILSLQSYAGGEGEYGGQQDPDKLAAEYEAFESLIGKDTQNQVTNEVASSLPVGLPSSIPDPLELIASSAEKVTKADKKTKKKEDSSSESSSDNSSDEDDSSDDSKRYCDNKYKQLSPYKFLLHQL